MNTERVVARLRRFHLEVDDDMSSIFDYPHVQNNHSQREIRLLMSLNAAVKRMNTCYSQRHPNHAHISSALRDSLKLMRDLEQHRVDTHMPQGVEVIEQRRPGGYFPADNEPEQSFAKPQYFTVDEIKRIGRKVLDERLT